MSQTMHRNAMCFALLSLALCGCGTIDNMMPHGSGQTVYGGVRKDLQHVAEAGRATVRAKNLPERAGAVGYTALSVVDTPLSAVGDTITLPLTVAKTLREKN